MERHIVLEGCHNFRDLGGYPVRGGRRVRWRQLFRSDALHALTEADCRVLRGGLDLRAVVDLRSTAELSAEGRGPLEREPVAFHHVPLFDGGETESRGREPESLADRYLLLARYAKGPIARVVGLLADAEGPAVYHCAAGKDRTGVISSLLLSCLGVDEELIAADYALSQARMDAIIERLIEMESYRSMLDVLPPETLHARPETMLAFLERLRAEHGSARDFLLSAGVAEEALDRLEARLDEA